jgi:hypothetical protein
MFVDAVGVTDLIFSSIPMAENTSTDFEGIRRSRKSSTKINKNPTKRQNGKIQTAMRLRALGDNF